MNSLRSYHYVKRAIYLALAVFAWDVTKPKLTHSLSNISQQSQNMFTIIENVLFDCSLSRDKSVALFQWHSQAALSIDQEKTRQRTKLFPSIGLLLFSKKSLSVNHYHFIVLV